MDRWRDFCICVLLGTNGGIIPISNNCGWNHLRDLLRNQGKDGGNMKREIEVKQIDNIETIRFTMLDNGAIHNYGRSLPF